MTLSAVPAHLRSGRGRRGWPAGSPLRQTSSAVGPLGPAAGPHGAGPDPGPGAAGPETGGPGTPGPYRTICCEPPPDPAHQFDGCGCSPGTATGSPGPEPGPGPADAVGGCHQVASADGGGGFSCVDGYGPLTWTGGGCTTVGAGGTIVDGASTTVGAGGTTVGGGVATVGAGGTGVVGFDHDHVGSGSGRSGGS